MILSYFLSSSRISVFLAFVFLTAHAFAQEKVEVKATWYTHKDTVNHYSVDFPSKPTQVPNTNSARIVSYADERNEIAYTATSMYTGPLKVGSADQYLDTVLQFYIKREGVKLLRKQSLTNDKITGVEVMLVNNGNILHSRMYYANSTFYTVSVEYGEDNFRNNYSDQYFRSFKTFQPAVPKSAQWFDYKNEEGAFTVRLPVTPEEIVREVPNPTESEYEPYRIRMFMSTDKIKLVNYLLRYNDFPRGMYLVNGGAIFDALIKEFESKGELKEKPRVIYKDGIEGRALGMVIQNSYMEVQMYLRGNRTYVILRQNLNGPQKSTEKDNFFESFKFAEYVPFNWVPFQLKNSSFVFPEQPVLLPVSENIPTSFLKDAKSYFSINPNSGGVYGLQNATVSPYFRSKSIDSLYDDIMQGLKGENDRLLKSEIVNIASASGKDYYLSDSLAGIEKRFRIWINKDQFFYQTAMLNKVEMQGQAAKDFFNKMTLVPDAKAFDLSASKTERILKDLKSSDTLVYKQALGALSYYKFEKDELPRLYTGLQHKYGDDTTKNGARGRLIGELETLNDERTLNVLKDLYKDQTNTEILRAHVLGVVTEVDKSSYEWYLGALKESNFSGLEDYWSLFKPLSDSLSYVSVHMDEVMEILKKDAYRPMVMDILSDMLSSESKDVYRIQLQERKEIIGEKAMEDLSKFIAELALQDETGFPLIYRYLNVLPELKRVELTDEFTKKVFQLDSVPYLKTAALAARIKAGLELDKTILAAQLDSLESRYEIMKAYHQSGKLGNVPAKYKKSEEFARLLFYRYAGDDYDYPLSVTLLGSVEEKGMLYYVFEFTYDEEGLKKNYIGICGAFAKSESPFKFEGYTSLSKYELKEADWKSQAKKLIIALDQEE